MSKNKPNIIIIKKGEEGHAAAHGGSWKVAYADFVTAMMALFLLLWLTMALKPQQKVELSMFFQDQELPKRERPTESVVMPTYMPKDAKMGAPQFKLSQEEQLKYEVALMLKELISKDPKLKQNSGISSEKSGVLMHVQSSLMFEPGAAVLKAEGLKVLDDVIKVMKAHQIGLVVRGHTDDTEAQTSKTFSKYELAGLRAASAARYIVEKGGVPAQRVTSVSYADSKPLVPNTSDQNKSINRRVEFLYNSEDMATIK